VTILRGVCAAVDAAHRRNLIHRDLKPENLFLARDGPSEQVKVLDFGVAKFLPSDTQVTQDADTGAGAMVGTMQYMGPEQLGGEPVDVSWDLWALAVVAYEILAGAKPFSGRTAAQWHAAVMGGRLVPISVHLPDAPPRWQEFFARALALDRRVRPASASALLSDFESALT
jgi:serine/threonine protein kinase